jgi:hypothetical protein
MYNISVRIRWCYSFQVYGEKKRSKDGYNNAIQPVHGFLKFDSYYVLSIRLAYCITEEVNIPGQTDSREWGNIWVQCKLKSFEDLLWASPSLTLVPAPPCLLFTHSGVPFLWASAHVSQL